MVDGDDGVCVVMIVLVTIMMVLLGVVLLSLLVVYCDGDSRGGDSHGDAVCNGVSYGDIV